MSDRVKEVTDTISYATLATVSADGEPWNTPVWSLHDADYTYYWCSAKESQHSRNIDQNGKVFIVVYDSTIPEGTGLGRGVYIQSTASEVADLTEIDRIIEKRKRLQPAYDRRATEFTGENPRRWYKATPRKIWLNASDKINGEYVDVREEIL